MTDPKDRKLVVSEPDAAVVRSIFERFVRIGSATVLARELRAEGVRTKRGKLVDKGYLYKLLNNRPYLGMAVHKGAAYAGEHAAIVPQDHWDKVHAILAEKVRTRSANTRAQTPALLKGLIFGPTGAAMSPTHTRKGKRLYRYYVSQDALKCGRDACPVGRVPAAEIEAAVIDQLRGIFRQPAIIVGTWRAARAEQDGITEDEAREAIIAPVQAGLCSGVEHVFADQKHRMGLFVRTIGIARARAKIGLANIVCNMRRLLFCEKATAAQA